MFVLFDRKREMWKKHLNFKRADMFCDISLPKVIQDAYFHLNCLIIPWLLNEMKDSPILISHLHKELIAVVENHKLEAHGTISVV